MYVCVSIYIYTTYSNTVLLYYCNSYTVKYQIIRLLLLQDKKTHISFVKLFTPSSLQYLCRILQSINQSYCMSAFFLRIAMPSLLWQQDHIIDINIQNSETNFTVTITYLPHRRHHRRLVHWWSRSRACLTGCLLGNDVWALWGDPTLQPWSWRCPGPAWAGPLPGNLSWAAVLPCGYKESKIKTHNHESVLMCLDIHVLLRNVRPAIIYRNVRHTTIYTRPPVILCRQHRASAAQDSRARSPRALAGSSWDTLCSVDDRPRWRHSTSISYFEERFRFGRW